MKNLLCIILMIEKDMNERKLIGSILGNNVNLISYIGCMEKTILLRDLKFSWIQI